MLMIFGIFRILLEKLQKETSSDFEKTHQRAAEVRFVVLTLAILNTFNKLFILNLE